MNDREILKAMLDLIYELLITITHISNSEETHEANKLYWKLEEELQED